MNFDFSFQFGSFEYNVIKLFNMNYFPLKKKKSDFLLLIACFLFLTMQVIAQSKLENPGYASNSEQFSLQAQIINEMKKSLDEYRFVEVQSDGNPTIGRDEKDQVNRDGAFYQHINEALRVNLERKEIYAQLTQGKSRSISRYLIWLERLSLIPARLIDRWGRTFQEKRIGIIQNDFVSMNGINQLDTAPK